ncbi:MAG TPA: DUF302 domain-containing protein [Thermoanaerobaculia bacterium]|jgi:uncharacterized protein (DUF302 family)|nr:DUF302 domain-containing protein [Thermoanaerobaculia bacterium]HPA52162.1 DUF302 domain-containing protein [Thermoanaerobaculia bacterium]HQN07981.1 DUF302 domain-containing protein [Thermoanaerobaculia bacterium]HQP86796.1 DUF302 domain-containing protein [Thermoanaerobaculia bacterium]
MKDSPVALQTTTPLSFADAVARAREELAREGFGVLTEIDVAATLKKKLDVDREPYLILGACHPPSAHKALSAVPEVGVLLPCNVTVSVEGGTTVVRAMDPAGVMGILGSKELAEVGADIGARLRRVVDAFRA